MFTLPRRPIGRIVTLLLASASLCANGSAQTPSVVSSTLVAVPHNEALGAPWQNAVSNRGDFVIFDFKTTGVYQYPASNGPEITVAAPNAIAGGFTDSGIAIDPRNNDMYFDNNYNGGLLKYPFDAATGKWDLPSVVVANGLAGNIGGSCGNYFQSAGLAINDNGVMAVATENGCGVEIFTVPIDASGNFGAATPIVANMTKRAKTVAIDDAGNIYFNEDSGLAGARYIPAGTMGLANDTTVARVDPFLGNVQGVSVDRAGNVYIADGSSGVFLVPLVNGVPNYLKEVQLTTAPAQSNASLDQAHGILFVPTYGIAGIKDVVKVYLNRAELGNVAPGTTGATPATIYYTFTLSETPASFVIDEAGSAGDFAVVSGGSCAAGTTGVSGTSCTVMVSFTPHTVGDLSANLLMLDGNKNVLATTVLHGVGQGASALILPATESTIGSGLKTPTQVAVDAAGNIYVADGGQGKVLEYAKGSGATTVPVSIGTGLTAPTGVAVDGAGNVYIADSGNILEVPYTPTGLNPAGQTTLQSGFGSGAQLASDGIGNVFVADPANSRVADLRALVVGSAQINLSGFTQLSAIAADGSGDLFIANGSNLIEISALGVQTTILNTLSNTTGLAVDASGAVYITSTTQTIRVPNEGGTLNPADQVVLARGVAKPASVAVDSLGNVYVADANSGSIDYINTSATLNLGTLASITSTSTASATVLNDGNAPLNVTGFSASPDFSVTTTSCIGAPIAVGSTCSATVTFNPGAGDQGTLSAQLLLQGNVVNPVGINVIGVGASLASSTSTITLNKPTVTNAPVIVTVASTAGTGPVPTGSVTLTVSGTGVTPIVLTQPLVNGTVTFNETTIPAGSLTFTAKYSGDRIYGTSTATTTATVGQGTLMLIQPAASTVPVYVLAAGTGAQEPYDGSQIPYYYNYLVSVKTANGAPLVGVPIYNSGGTQTGVDYGHVTYQLAGGATACTGNASTINVAADGTAPFPTSCFAINTSNNQIPNLQTSYTFTPVYTGNTNGNYGMVTGAPVTVIALRNPSVVINSNPGALTVASGSTATTTLTVTSLLGYGIAGANGNLNNYSLPVEMGCDALPAHATCSFSYPTPDPSDPNSVAVNPTTPGSVIMTINTNVAVGTTTASVERNTALFAAITGFGMLGLAFGRRKTLRATLFSLALVLGCASAVAGLSACSSANITATPVLTTPKGTYNITVTAKQAGSKSVPNPVSGGAPITVYGNGNQVSIPFTMSVTVQ